jgi:hypothetical protein
LEIFAEGEPFAPELIGWLGSQNHSARAVMSAPVITVSEETNLPDIAEILTTHRIKRVLSSAMAALSEWSAAPISCALSLSA